MNHNYDLFELNDYLGNSFLDTYSTIDTVLDVAGWRAYRKVGDISCYVVGLTVISKFKEKQYICKVKEK